MSEMHTRSIDQGGPGQSGAASGRSRFDEAKPGEQRYPTDSSPGGSRSRFEHCDAPSSAKTDDPDGQLRSRVLEALRAGELDVSKLEVIVAGGVVTLIGTVEDGPSLSLAEDRAEHVSGVDEVDNKLLVEGR